MVYVYMYILDMKKMTKFPPFHMLLDMHNMHNEKKCNREEAEKRGEDGGGRKRASITRA